MFAPSHIAAHPRSAHAAAPVPSPARCAPYQPPDRDRGKVLFLAVAGAPRSMRLPFKCSTGFILDTHKLQMLSAPTLFGMRKEKFGGAVTPPLPIRGHSFLHDPRTAVEIKQSVTSVVLPRGSTNVQVLAGTACLRPCAPWAFCGIPPSYSTTIPLVPHSP